MALVTSKKISVQTKGNGDAIDITAEIIREVSNSSISSGLATIFISGSTAGITTIEYEEGLVRDFQEMWARITPQNLPYQHNLKWGDGNGHAHIRASLLGPSLTIPFVNKKLTLGTWQQIIVVDFDNRSRFRELILQLIGE